MLPEAEQRKTHKCVAQDAVLKFHPPCLTLFSCLHQVTAKEIRQLEGPTKPLPMEILEIDVCSGLVVGMNGYANQFERDEIGKLYGKRSVCFTSN